MMQQQVSMSSAGWVRSSPANPCKICGHHQNCEELETDDATLVYCGRVSDGSKKQNSGGQWLHVLSKDGTGSAFGYTHPGHLRDQRKRSEPKRPPASKSHVEKFTRRAERFYRSDKPEIQSLIAHHRRLLSSKLGVSVESLCRLMYGYCPSSGEYKNPERDPGGRIIGISRRLPDGQKKTESGSKRGLTYANDWDTGSGPLLIVEGGSDTAALMDLGISTIGRFSNLGGVGMLCEMLASFPHAREIIVVAERDEKHDGQWPGRDGAVKCAQQMAGRLNRRVGWALPPDEAKDSRVWTNIIQGSRSVFLAGLIVEWIKPPPVFDPANTDKEFNLDAWRKELSQSRETMLDYPGIYLDGSPTGSGKSHGDIELAKRAGATLLVMPSHDNCKEVEADMTEAGVMAKAYPARLMSDVSPPCPRCQKKTGQKCCLCGGAGILHLQQNCWNPFADEAESIGLPVVSTVCPSCPQTRKCKEIGYLSDIREASESRVAIATHARGEHGGILALGKGRTYQAIHEDSSGLFRPMIETGESDLRAATELVEDLLTNPQWLDWFGSGRDEKDQERRGEIYEFLNHMLTVAESVASQARHTNQSTRLNLPSPLTKPKGIEAVLFEAFRQSKTKFQKQPLKALISLSAGRVHQAGVVISERFIKRQAGTGASQNDHYHARQHARGGCNRASL